MSSYLSTHSQSQTTHAQRANRARYVVLMKGVFDVFFSLGIMFMPIAAYDGPVPAFVSKVTGLQFIYRDADPGGAYALASLTMGCAVAALSAGMSHQDDAYKVVATLNGVFAYTGLLGCMLSPKKFGSSILLLAAIQDVFWFFLIVNAGGFTIGETIGLKSAVERASKKKEELDHERDRRAHEHVRGEKDRYGERQKEGYGSTGNATSGQYTGTQGSGYNGQHSGTQGTGYGGQHQQQRQTHSSASTGGGLGGSGFGTGVQQHGVGTGNEGSFGNHGLKAERFRGVEPHH